VTLNIEKLGYEKSLADERDNSLMKQSNVRPEFIRLTKKV